MSTGISLVVGFAFKYVVASSPLIPGKLRSIIIKSGCTAVTRFYGFTGCSGFKGFVAETINAEQEQCSAIVVVVHYEYFLFPISHNTHSRIRDAS